MNQKQLTNKEKLKFIKEVVKYRAAGLMSRGCEYDWFFGTYRDYKNVEAINFPKYVVFAPSEEQLNHWSACILTREDNFEARYYAIRPSLYIIDEGFGLDAAWRNGYKKETQYNLVHKIVDEDYYIDDMYKIAKMYYENDIETVLKQRELEEQQKFEKEKFAKSFFRL